MDEIEAKRLVDTYSDLILRISFTYLKSTYDAEDICQNIFIKYLNADMSFKSEEHEKAWIIRSTINACKDILKSAYNKKIVVMDNVYREAADTQKYSDVKDAVMNLPEKYRTAIYLYYFEGYSAKEIAKLTRKNENIVALNLSRGRKKLRGMLENYNMERVKSYEKAVGK